MIDIYPDVGGFSSETLVSVNSVLRRPALDVPSAAGGLLVAAEGVALQHRTEDLAALHGGYDPEIAETIQPPEITGIGSHDVEQTAETDDSRTLFSILDRQTLAIGERTEVVEPQKLDILRVLSKHLGNYIKCGQISEELEALIGISFPAPAIGRHAKELENVIFRLTGKRLLTRLKTRTGYLYGLDPSVEVTVADGVDLLITEQSSRYRAVYSPLSSRVNQRYREPDENQDRSVHVVLLDNNSLRIGKRKITLGPNEVFVLNAVLELGSCGMRAIKALGFYEDPRQIEEALHDLRDKLVNEDGSPIFIKVGGTKVAKYHISELVEFVDLRDEKYDPGPSSTELLTVASAMVPGRHARSVGRAALSANPLSRIPKIQRPKRPKDHEDTDLDQRGDAVDGTSNETITYPELHQLYTRVVDLATEVDPEERRRIDVERRIDLERSIAADTGLSPMTVRDLLLWRRLHAALGLPLPGVLRGASTLEAYKTATLRRVNTLLNQQFRGLSAREANMSKGVFALLTGLPPASKATMRSLAGVRLHRSLYGPISYESAYAWLYNRNLTVQYLSLLLHNAPNDRIARHDLRCDLLEMYNGVAQSIRATANE